MRAFRIVLWTAFFGLIAFTVFAQNPKMLKDIYPGGTGSGILNMHAVVNNMLYFPADDGTHGKELWKSDGTTTGTQLVKDIHPGSAWSNNASSPEVVFRSCLGLLWFGGNDGYNNGCQPWKSDGTAPGTVMIKDVCTGRHNADPTEFTVMNGIVYFAAATKYRTIKSGSNSAMMPVRDLLRSDGTAPGTYMVKDINPQGQLGARPYGFTTLGNTLFFIADHKSYGFELWKSDGTQAGTVIVKDLYPGTASGANYPPVAYNNVLLFGGSDATTGWELWKTTGTAASTVKVVEINPTGSAGPAYFMPMNGLMYFMATDGQHGRQIWRTDATAAGTWAVTNINPTGNPFPLPCAVLNLPTGNIMLFTADDGVNGRELWATDGVSSAWLVKDIHPTGSSVGLLNPYTVATLDGKLYFIANDGTHGSEVWVSDGTPAGTQRLADVAVSPAGSEAANVVAMNGVLLYRAADAVNGDELWVYDPTPPSPKARMESAIATGFELYQNHPNPFNPSTTIDFTLPEAAVVTLCVYDMLGREAVILVNGEMESGRHQVVWHADGVASGMYTCRLECRGRVLTRAMHLMK